MFITIIFLKEIKDVRILKDELQKKFRKEYQLMLSEIEKVDKQLQSLAETDQDEHAEEVDNLKRSIALLEEQNKKVCI